MGTNWIGPPENLTLDQNQVDVWRVSILDFPPDSVRWMESMLSAEENRRAARFHFEIDRHRFILSHGALRDILARYLYISPEDVQFEIGEHGKPIISSKPGLDFNLSHSGDFALIAIGNGHKIGVDVEKHRHDMEYEKIAQRFFSEREKIELKKLSTDQKVIGFFNCWTRKEAYIKAQGLGLLLPLDDFDVSLTPNQPAILHATRPDPQEASNWILFSVQVHPDHTGAVAVNGKNMRLRLWDWDPTQ